MKLTEKEIEVVKYLVKNGEITSGRLRDIFKTEGKKKTLTIKNFPNIRNKLYSYMTSYSHGMCRGGFNWVSVVSLNILKMKNFLKIV